MNIEIEKFEKEDPKELLEFARTNFIETYAHLNTSENMDSYLVQHFTPQVFKREYMNPDSEFFVARNEEEIVGYFKVNFDQAQTEPDQPNSCEIERIYVAKKLKGKGIGKMLFFAAVDYAKRLNKDYVWLGVWEENHRAIHFYEKAGMRRFGTHFFQLGDDAQRDLLMRLDLD